MATARELKEKIYFEEVYKVLEGIKMKIYVLREELAKTYGKESKELLTQDRHLIELAEYVEWKLQVLEKGSSFDWQYTRGIKPEVETVVSVRPPDNLSGPDFSGGYLGG